MKNIDKKLIKAELKYHRASPRKVRIVSDLVKGKKVSEALARLNFLAKRPINPITKLIKSAVSNAKNNFKIQDENNLVIKSITVNSGPTLKRYMPRSRGMANQILKRTSRLKIILEENKK